MVQTLQGTMTPCVRLTGVLGSRIGPFSSVLPQTLQEIGNPYYPNRYPAQHVACLLALDGILTAN
jgi:hypothetical protein